MTPDTQKMTESLSEAQIRAWLLAHPDFLKQNPDLLLALKPPAAQSGDNVLDFQQHMLGHLQDHLREMKQRYEGLIVASRDNMSTQSQVHQAVLGIVRAQDLEQLLQMLTQDLVQYFDLDMVRLAMESPVAEFYPPQYDEKDYSGLCFVDTGIVQELFGTEDVCLMASVMAEMTEPLRQVLQDCVGLIKSCALLRLHLPHTDRAVALIFGVRHEGRFHPNQGVELLKFLAEVVEYKLDQCLLREGIEEI